MSLTRYTIGGPAGDESPAAPWDPLVFDEYPAADEFAREVGGSVVEHTYEWAESELVVDYSETEDPDGD